MTNDKAGFCEELVVLSRLVRALEQSVQSWHIAM